MPASSTPVCVAEAVNVCDTVKVGGIPSVVLTVAVPEHVAVPEPKVAEVGALVYPLPTAVIESAVPEAIVLEPVSVTVAVAPDPPPLNDDSVQVCPELPLIVPPELYVPEPTSDAVEL